jgi:signal transduction histidine kinase
LQTQESRLTDWLEPRAIPRPWETAPVLAASGWTVESLSALAEQLPETALAPVVLWLEADLAVRQLLDEIQMSARAISRIVEAVKSYAYLDKAPVQDVDIRQSLEDTLVILAHKLKHGIEIVRDLEPGLPSVEAYAGELNQVWTNIIDNAIQAMDGNGRLELAVRRLGDEVEVRIADSGPGIPPELTSRVFEPFFTTKPQGVGTGLGLHISHNIIVGRHHGRIAVTSRPGHTEFRVLLPLRQAPV